MAHPSVTLPRDVEDNRFIQSFSLTEQEDEYKQFFEQYGFVVIRNALDQQDIDQTLSDIWNTITSPPPQNVSCSSFEEWAASSEEQNESSNKVDKDDPNTWTNEHGWPCFSHVGLLGLDVATEASAFRNRQNPNVYQAYSKILGTEELFVSVDRFGVMRPTTQVLQKDGVSRVDYPEYGTEEKWLHWDLNPWKLLPKNAETTNTEVSDYEIDIRDPGFFITENNDTSFLPPYFKVQGLVALTDCTEDDGGFLCVPFFQKEINQWAEANEGLYERKKDKTYVSVPSNDSIVERAVKIPIRTGSLLIWDSRLPHCNFPNHSDKFRIVQYIKMFPIMNKGEKFLASRSRLLQKLMTKSSFTPTDLGRQLFGLNIDPR